MAILIPSINVTNILVVAWLCSGSASAGRLVRVVATNPLVIGCALGLAINAAPIELPRPILETLDIIGRAALGIGLLVVGAGLSAERLRRFSIPVAIGAALRPLLLPLVFLAADFG